MSSVGDCGVPTLTSAIVYSKRWKRVDDVLQSVLELPPEERDDFLRNACVVDETLEFEVRSLRRGRACAIS